MNDIAGSSTDLVAMVRDQAHAWAAGRRDLAGLRARRRSTPGYDPALQREMAELGWFGAVIPERYGGLGLGFAAMGAIIEEAGAALLADPLAQAAVLAARTVLHAGDEALRQELLPRIAAGTLLPAVAWQEGGSIDPEQVTTTARGGTLNGRKRFVGFADCFIVSARTEAGIGLFWLPPGAAGAAVEVEWRADDTPGATLTLTDAAARPLDGPALAGLRRALEEAAVMASAELLGVMSAALAMTLDYMRTRTQFGVAIGSFQALQHKAVDLHTQKELSAAALAGALPPLDGELPAAERARLAARVKARCSDAAQRITREAIQLHGAIGFTDECDIGLYLKRSLVVSAWLGNGDAQRRRVAALGHVAISDAAPNAVAVPAPGQQDWNAMPDESFRAVAAAVFDACCPPSARFPTHRPRWAVVKPFYEALSRQGWLAPAWPVAFGGMGLSPGKLMLYFEEWGRLGMPRLIDQGINNVASVLISRGTPEQQLRFLPKILTGEHRWCQGYSEPNAGSDLAGLRTEARLEGDAFVINGSKIWTTMAQDATHLYALVRTDKAAKKQAGLTFLLIDMDQPGVTVRPIRNIAGEEEFCQVFLDDVRTPAENLVGGLNEGWLVAKTLLGFERNKEGSPRQCRVALQRLEQVARGLGLMEDAVFLDRFTQLAFDVADQGALYERFAQALRGGAMPAFEVSMMKVWASETLQRLTEALIDVAGPAGGVSGMQAFGQARADIVAPFLDTRAFTILGGTNQIQRNILAKQVLRL